MAKKKILLADGAVEEMEALEEALKEIFVTVFTASTAEEALDIHRNEKVDFILADLELPEMGGDALCSLIRSDEAISRVYITLICGGRNPELQRCGKCGANNYVKRPVEVEEMVERMMRVLELSRRRAERVLVKVSVKGLYNNESFFCMSHNISATGILLETDKVLAKGDVISCSFFLPDEERVLADGRVTRVVKAPVDDGYCYGIEFMELKDESRSAIEKFIIVSVETSPPSKAARV